MTQEEIEKIATKIENEIQECIDAIPIEILKKLPEAYDNSFCVHKKYGLVTLDWNTVYWPYYLELKQIFAQIKLYKTSENPENWTFPVGEYLLNKVDVIKDREGNRRSYEIQMVDKRVELLTQPCQ